MLAVYAAYDLDTNELIDYVQLRPFHPADDNLLASLKALCDGSGLDYKVIRINGIDQISGKLDYHRIYSSLYNKKEV